MRLLPLLTKFTTILVAQQLISIWFLVDFFAARDSMTANNLWRRSSSNKNDSISETLLLAKTVERERCQANHEATFDKLIFIIIDALGSSFIPIIENATEHSADSMPFIINSIRQQTAMGFVAKAATPTVTMPRVKALLSGTIPSFVDIVYNLASDVSRFDDDNIVGIAKNSNKTLVFYGDDTWLSLFSKSTFARLKETFSFFASDYTTVDTNVTEKALPETSADKIDWDFLILHYLGLDHIGHAFGNNENALIRAKLIEMDTIIKQIHNNMSRKRHKTLVVVCGDHGMSKEGNHGGGSDLESNTAVLFMPIGKEFREPTYSTKSSHPPVKQVDLAVTLSLVLGSRIPAMSKGVAIEPFLTKLWSGDESRLVCALLSNLIQLASLLDVSDLDSLSKQGNLVQILEHHLNSTRALRAIAQSYYAILRQMQEKLLDSVVSRSCPYSLMSLLSIVTLLSIISLRKITLRLLVPTMSKVGQLICLVTILSPILMLASTDFIEYEHKIWGMFSLISFIILIGMQKDFVKSMYAIDLVRAVLFIPTATITSLRIFTSNSDEETASTSAFIQSTASVLLLCNFLKQNSDIKKCRGISVAVIGVVIISTKLIEESSAINHVHLCAMTQRVAMLVVIIYSIAEIIATKDSLHARESEGIGPVALVIRKLASGLMCIGFLLARRRDFVFLTSNILMETSLNSICNSLRVPLIVRSIVYYNFAQASFYNHGNSNSFSSINVMPAFFGQTTYNIYLSIPLVVIATYSTHIYWILKLFQRVQDDKTTLNTNLKLTRQQSLDLPITTKDSAENHSKLIRDAIIMRNFIGLSFYMFVCMWLRNHLFIWSVLSPKLVYQSMSNFIILAAIIAVSSLSDIQRLVGGDHRISKCLAKFSTKSNIS